MLQPGQVIGGTYRLERAIGYGAFATVWAATNTLTEQPVALKILADVPAKRPTVVARFFKEARICATPIHPTVVTVKDMGQTDEGIPYIAMELLIGHTLDQVLRAKGSLPWAMCVEVMQHVLAGLSAAHQRDIIHRDIKPSNIFLVETSCSGPPVRVLDLGLARDLADDKRLTRTGQVVGTANYLPPETLLDEQPKGGTKSGDVFAAGMVLFVALTGRFPFLTTGQAATPVAEVFARASFYKSRAPLPGPLDFDSTLPVSLDRVVRKALNVDRSQRYADAPNMLADLEKATQEILPGSDRGELTENLAQTCLGLPSNLADADLIESGEAEVVAPFEGLGFDCAPSPSLAKTSVAYPIQVVGVSPVPPEIEVVGAQGPHDSPRPSASSRPSMPSRASAPSLPGSSRPSWIRRSPVGLSLVGIVVGTLMGAMILGGIVVWRLVVRPQAVIVTQPSGHASTKAHATIPRPLVEMELQGVPEGASVRLDDQQIEGTAIRGPLGSRAVLFVESASYEPLRFELTFSPGKNLDVAAHLRPVQPEPIDVQEQMVDLPSKSPPPSTRRSPRHRTPHADQGAASKVPRGESSPSAPNEEPDSSPAVKITDPWTQ